MIGPPPPPHTALPSFILTLFSAEIPHEVKATSDSASYPPSLETQVEERRCFGSVAAAATLSGLPLVACLFVNLNQGDRLD